MMQILNKFASFIVIGIIGYLTYSALSSAAARPAVEEKGLPVVTEKMLKPEFLEAKDNASPAGRDPFDVTGIGYEEVVDESPAIAADANTRSNNIVDFPEKLMGVLTGDDGQKLALIGGEVYGVGSQITAADSNTIWEVASIEDETVILTHNGLRAILTILDLPMDNNDAEQQTFEDTQEQELKQ